MRVPSSDDVELELHDLGGDGPPLLIAHATGFCAGAYRPLAACLTGRFHVWAVDFRAHGDATRPASGSLDWGGMVQDVVAVVDALGGGPVAGIGHSMGGAALVGAEIARPGTLTRAYLFEPIIVPEGWGGTSGPNPMSEAAARRRRRFASHAEALARYAHRPPLGVCRADALAAYVDAGFRELPDGTVELKCSPEDEAAVFAATGKITIADVGDVGVPIVVARGGRDGEFGPAAFAGAVAGALPRGELRRYEHVGHFGPLSDPDTIGEDALAFLAG